MYVAVIRCSNPSCKRLVPRSILEYTRLTYTCGEKKCRAKRNYIESKCNFILTPMMITACLVAFTMVDSNLLPFIFNQLRVPMNTYWASSVTISNDTGVFHPPFNIRYPVQNRSSSVIGTATPNTTLSPAAFSSSSQSPLSIPDVTAATSAPSPVTACTLTPSSPRPPLWL
eukprot:g41302.t1